MTLNHNFKTIAQTIAKERRKTEKLRCCHVAFILYKSRIISIGVNDLRKSHPLNKRFRYHNFKNSICAELSAVIRGRKEDYTGHTLVIVRIDRNNKLNYSCPCSGCKGLISTMNFKNVYFSNKDGEFVNYEATS